MAASIGGTGTPARWTIRPTSVGTMMIPTAAAYSDAVERGAGAGSGAASFSSSPLITTTSMGPLPRTSASSSEPRHTSRQRGRRGAAQRHGSASQLLRQLERAHQVLALVAGEPLVGGGLDVERDPLGVEPGRHAPGSADQPGGADARSHADQQPLAGGPGLPDAALGHVAAHLRIHPLGGAAE